MLHRMPLFFIVHHKEENISMVQFLIEENQFLLSNVNRIRCDEV